MTERKRCSEPIRNHTGYWSPDVTCSNSAKVEVDGKPYCGIHDPVQVKARRAESNRTYNKRQAQQFIRREREALERETCWGVPTEMLRAGLLKELLLSDGEGT